MEPRASIKRKIERISQALTLKPSRGLGTGISTSRIENGLSCQVHEGDWTMKVDMPSQVGGNDSAPVPGFFGRGALGSCLAIGFKMFASKLGVHIDSIEVEVQADWDDGGLFGTSGSPPGYLEVRYRFRVESSASEDKIMEVPGGY